MGYRLVTSTQIRHGSRAMQQNEVPRASSHYEIRLMHAETPPSVARIRKIWTFVLSLAVPWHGLLPYDYEPKHECRVEVRRVTDGRVMVAYDYVQELEAVNHLHSLRERASEMSVSDFDRALGLRESW